MKLPIYEELDITSLREPHALKARLLHSSIGKGPVYIPAEDLGKSELVEFLDSLSIALDELGISTNCPYPIYIVTNGIPVTSRISKIIVKSAQELPKFFFKKLRRPRNKEATLMAKLQMLSEKIATIDTEAKIERVKEEFSLQDSIYLKCSELEHIETIEMKLREKRK